MQISNPHVRGYCRPYCCTAVDPYAVTQERRLFRDKISLILEHQADILSCSDYFFCELHLAHCLVGAPGGALLRGPIRLGHLLIGWRHGSLVDQCRNCGGNLLITSFSGNIKEGTNRSNGLCMHCAEWSSVSSIKAVFWRRLEIASRILKRLPDQVEEHEIYSGYQFAWCGDGLEAATKRRLAVRKLYTPAPFDVLIHELEITSIRKGRPPVVGLSQDDLKRKFSERNQ